MACDTSSLLRGWEARSSHGAPQHGRLKAAFDFAVHEPRLDAVLCDASSPLNLEANASSHVHVRGVNAHELSVIVPDLNQVLFKKCLSKSATPGKYLV